MMLDGFGGVVVVVVVGLGRLDAAADADGEAPLLLRLAARVHCAVRSSRHVAIQRVFILPCVSCQSQN